MGLPFQPEPLDALKDRYPAALAEVFDMESIGLGVAPTPGSYRRQVFDHECGIRMVVSRQRYTNGQVELHMSASLRTDSKLFRKLEKKAKRLNCNPAQLLMVFVGKVTRAWYDLTGHTALIMVTATPEGVVHFTVPTDEMARELEEMTQRAEQEERSERTEQ